MSVRSFHAVYMTGAVAAAALSCYLVSLRVASERAALDGVETRIVQTQSDIRMLQTEIGTRGRLDQLEQWNASALSLSAPAANQFVEDSFQLAKLAAPDHHLDVKAPVVMASAPAPQPTLATSQADEEPVSQPSASPSELVHEASLKIEPREGASSFVPAAAPAPAKVKSTPKLAAAKAVAPKAAAPKPPIQKSKPHPASATNAPTRKPAPLSIASAHESKPIRLAEADPLAPLPSGKSRPIHSEQSRDSGRRK
jgi:hypothetical protein